MGAGLENWGDHERRLLQEGMAIYRSNWAKIAQHITERTLRNAVAPALSTISEFGTVNHTNQVLNQAPVIYTQEECRYMSRRLDPLKKVGHWKEEEDASLLRLSKVLKYKKPQEGKGPIDPKYYNMPSWKAICPTLGRSKSACLKRLKILTKREEDIRKRAEAEALGESDGLQTGELQEVQSDELQRNCLTVNVGELQTIKSTENIPLLQIDNSQLQSI